MADLVPDPERALERRIGAEYAPVAPGGAADAPAADEGRARFATSIVVEKVTSQDW